MQRVVVDANVFVSLLTGRHEKPREIAAALLHEAEDGEVVVILPQFVIFEVTYVLQDASIAALATTNRYDAIATFDQKLGRRAKDLGVASYW